MKKLRVRRSLGVVGLAIGLLLSAQLDSTSPHFRKHETKSQARRREQQNAYREDCKLAQQDAAVHSNKNARSILSPFYNYTQDQKDATQFGVGLVTFGLVEGYCGYQMLQQKIWSDRATSMIFGTCIAAHACVCILNGQNIIFDAYQHKDWYNIMRRKGK